MATVINRHAHNRDRRRSHYVLFCIILCTLKPNKYGVLKFHVIFRFNYIVML